MNFLETLVATPLSGAVGWTLLHSLWEGAIIAAALGAVLLATQSPRARYTAGCTAMLLMLASFGLTLARMSAGSVHGLHTAKPPAFPPWNVHTELETPSLSSSGLATVVPWLAPFWMVGVCIFCMGHLASWISIARLRRHGVCCAPEQWQQHLARLSVQLRLSRPVRLLDSCMVNVPIVLGHFRPVILMPIGLLAGLPTGQIEAILLHELAHIRRYDYLVNVFQRSVAGLLFYHPATWWISGVIRAERENCCDDVVVAIRGNAREYAVALAALEQNRWSGREPALAATGGSLVKRIRRLLYPKSPNGAWTPVLAAVILMATAALTLFAWQSTPPQPGAAAVQSPDRAATSPFERWLNEDVVYIISDDERAAFQKLTTDNEREKFIEQFWLRRDPVPGTAVNEYKEEHYRRIAYANQHFRTRSGRPGWQTDRGHMYVIYGPPDELENHPNGGAQTSYPFDAWMYRHIEGIGDNLVITFVDPLRTGDYRFAPGSGR